MHQNPIPRTKLLASEDYWAIWLGAAILLFGILFFFTGSRREQAAKRSELEAELTSIRDRAPFRTLRELELESRISALSATGSGPGKVLAGLVQKPKNWKNNPLQSVYRGEHQAPSPDPVAAARYEALEPELAEARAHAQLLEDSARSAQYTDPQLNQRASEAIGAWQTLQLEQISLAKKVVLKPYFSLPWILAFGAALGLLFGLGIYFMNGPVRPFLKAYFGVFLLALISYVIGSQSDVRSLGLGNTLWAIVLGMIISNTVGTPGWMKPALSTEFYIKTGLVLLGAEILFGKILAIGIPGIFVAWVVTPIVLIATFWFGQKVLKIGSRSLNITISADMSVCGISAAIATAAACRASREELTLAVGLSMVFTSIMMILMPLFIVWVGMPPVLGGAWIGGTIDATGAVVAAGAILGDQALNVAATIKMIQNILIGVIAFGVAVYWSTRVDNAAGRQVGWSEIIRRFPKFILGFVGASLLFSVLLEVLPAGEGQILVEQGILRGFTVEVREWLFCLAFVSIGLSTNFAGLRHQLSGGKPLLLYVCGQTFNLLLTLLMAWLMFYVVFTDITSRL